MPNFAAVSWLLLLRTAAKKVETEVTKKQGQIPEWPNGADCKSAGVRLRWFESIFAHNIPAECFLRK